MLRNGEWRRQRLTISNSTSTPRARLRTLAPIPTTPTAAIAPAPQRQVSDVLMDAGLSRWLLALGNSDVAARANVLPLRDHERQSRFQPPPQFNAPPLRAVQYASPIRTSACSQRARPANKYWWCVKDAGLSRCLLRSSQFQRPTASRPRTRLPKPTPPAVPQPLKTILARVAR